jgi:hypothetical protein
VFTDPSGGAKEITAITRLMCAFQEELFSLDELRSRMPSCAPARPACATRSTPSTRSSWQIAFDRPRVSDAARLLLGAARRLEPLDPALVPPDENDRRL